MQSSWHQTCGALLASVLILSPVTGAQEFKKRAITFKDLISMHRVADPQLSPDQQSIAYTVSTPDLDANRSATDIWVASVASGESRQLTQSGNNQRPRWSPDGKKLTFLSSRQNIPQVYSLPLGGGEATQMTALSTGADNQLWSPDGKWIAFTSSVYPKCKVDACNAKLDQQQEQSKVKAHIYEKLLYRHWTNWWDGKRSHLFIVPASGGPARDLTPGADYDVPPFSLGGPEAIAFSPDSQQLCFTANTDKDEALSTNGDLFTVPVSGTSDPVRVTSNPGDDWGAVYSPDGKWIAYRAQLQAGYESDRWRLMLIDRSNKDIAPVNLTENFDFNVESVAWSADSRTIYFETEEKAELPVYSIAATAGAAPKPVLTNSSNDGLEVSRDGTMLVFVRTTLTMPAEIFVAKADGTETRQITHQNTDLLAQLDLQTAESFWFTGADGTPVQAMMLRPPHFDASKKYPMLLLIHGGPQGEWDNSWGYRWNEQVMAAPGYVVVAINPRGSFGYGHKFTEEISKDWGGKAYDDLMAGVDAAIKKYPFIDQTRLAAAGGSYGGYMVDWIATHTGRFKCLISHAGPYNETSMYGSTEELWFMDWEFAGPPWSSQELYTRWSPSEYATALAKFKTPTLVMGGELDFRVPYTQDLEFFTALQRQTVPSKLVIFPDEGHWVLKPQNSQLWYESFLNWLAKYLN